MKRTLQRITLLSIVMLSKFKIDVNHFHFMIMDYHIYMNPLLIYYPILILHIVNPQVRQLYQTQSNYADDAGYDLKFPHDVNFTAHQTQWINFQVSPHMKIDSIQSWGYLIAPRSSISQTPLHLVVSPGVIDASYVGNLILPFRSHHNYSVLRGQSVAQIIFPTLQPFHVNITDFPNQRQTTRGSKGFGSTNHRSASVTS
jgi:dUTP pyrophosphatase